MIDLIFLLLVTVCAILTPDSSEYKLINRLLFAKFCVFIGLHYITIHIGLFDGDYVDIYRASLDLIFMGLFVRVRGYFLSILCFSMAVFHIANIFMIFDYERVMITFMCLQLMACVGGMIDDWLCTPGTRRRFFNTHTPRH